MTPNAGISRRRLLQRGAVAGAVAWTAPVILASSARADGVCTPACLPKGAPIFTATARGSCKNSQPKSYTVTASLGLDPRSPVVCECGGTPTIEPGTLTAVYSVSVSGTRILSGSVRVVCVDGTDDECSLDYRVDVTVNIVKGNPGNDCNGNTVTVTNVSSSPI